MKSANCYNKFIIMKSDIAGRGDIEVMVRTFYDKVRIDPVIGPIFNDVANINWEKHLPVMFDFWENTIFFTGGYSGNPMKPHQELNRIFPLQEKHFSQWLELFRSTVDELFVGEKAELAKQRAMSIATIMQVKFKSPC